MMLDRRSDDVPAAVATSTRYAQNRVVICLGPATGEDDFARARAQGLRDLIARTIDGSACSASLGMDGTWVVPEAGMVGLHRGDDFRANRRRGGVIQIGSIRHHFFG